MFAKHQAAIGRHARASADNMADVLTFVILTIRQPLAQVPGDMADVKAKGEAAACLWGFKLDAYRHVQQNKAAIYSDAMAIYDMVADPGECERQLLDYFARLPGMGLVKGGFAAQLCFGVGGCLDTHNIVRFGLREDDFKASRYKAAKRPATRYKMLDVYQDLLKLAGGCEQLWNDWCAYVADNQPVTYDGAAHVSRLHCEALGLAVE